MRRMQEDGDFQPPKYKLDPQSANTVFSFDVGLFLLLLSIFVGIVYHRKAQSPALKFIGHHSNYPFYISALVSSFIILLASSFVDNIETLEFTSIAYGMFGCLLASNGLMIGFINSIGYKYYPSYLCRRASNKATQMRVMAIAIFAIMLGLILPFLWNNQLYECAMFSNLLLIAYTSVVSFYSKMAQIQWYFISILFCMKNNYFV